MRKIPLQLIICPIEWRLAQKIGPGQAKLRPLSENRDSGPPGSTLLPH